MLLAPRFSTDVRSAVPSTAHIDSLERHNHNMNHKPQGLKRRAGGFVIHDIICVRPPTPYARPHSYCFPNRCRWMGPSPLPLSKSRLWAQPQVRRNAKNHAKNAYKIVSSGRDARLGVRDRVPWYTLLTHNLILDRIEQYTNSPNTTFVALSTYHSANRM